MRLQIPSTPGLHGPHGRLNAAVLRLACLCLLAWLLPSLLSGAWAAEPPRLQLDPQAQRINLTEHMLAQRLPTGPLPEPGLLWLGDPGASPVEPAPRWRSEPGRRIVARAVLEPGDTTGTYVVQVPAAWFDEVRLWHRAPGGAWASAMAGDRVALSRWPFVTQSPAFIIPLRGAPLELMMVLTNDAPARVPVWLMTDGAYRAGQVRQANLSGLNMGLGMMVVVFTVLGAAVQRRRASLLLAGVAGWVLLTVCSLNGYMAIWFTPELPGLNDASKHFTGVMMSALMMTLTAQALDQRYLSRTEHVLKVAVPAVVLLYAVVQALWLPGAWRLPAAAVLTLGTLAASVVMCALSALRGGRYVRWIMAALGCYAAAVALVYAPFDFVAGLDLRAALVALLLFSSLLLFYHALFLRERYGRDVLGRAGVAATRDPLTALLSYQGLQQAYDEALLRQGAGQQQTPVMLFLLPGLEQSAVDHGFVLTERVVVRFAATLQGVLGDSWSIARISKTRFACIGMGDARASDVLAVATQVLASCSRLTDTIAPVAEFDLRIACAQRRLAPSGLKALLSALEDACHALVPPKRIALVQESRGRGARGSTGDSTGNSVGHSVGNSQGGSQGGYSSRGHSGGSGNSGRD